MKKKKSQPRAHVLLAGIINRLSAKMDAMDVEHHRQFQLIEMRLTALEMRPVFVQVQTGEARKDYPVSVVYGGKP